MTPTPIDEVFRQAAIVADLLPIVAGLTLAVVALVTTYNIGKASGSATTIDRRPIVRRTVSIEEISRQDAQSRAEPRLLYDALRRISLVTGSTREAYPDSLTKRQYRRLVEWIVDVDDGGMARLNKETVVAVARALGIDIDSRASTDDHLEAIGNVAGYDYEQEAGGLRKDQLIRLAETLVDRKHNGRLEIEETDEEGGE